MRRRCCRVSLKHGGLPNPTCIGHRTRKSSYMIKVQLSHHSELVTKCSCINQQPTPPRLTSSQDHRVGHITCVIVRIGLGSARWLRVRRQALNRHINDFINSLPTLPATANDQSIPSWLKPILCPQWGHCISTGLNGDSRMAWWGHQTQEREM